MPAPAPPVGGCAPNNAAGSTCTRAIGAVPAHGSGSLSFAVSVLNPVAAGASELALTSRIHDDGSRGPDPTPSDNLASETTPLDAAPELRLTKAHGGTSVLPGGAIIYRLTYQNAGNQGATGVIVTETVPARTVFSPVSSTPGWSCAPNILAGSTCHFTVGALAGSSSAWATFVVVVDSHMPTGLTQITNTASVADDGANGADPLPANNNASDSTNLVAAPDLVLLKDDGGALADTGVTIVYTLTYQNAGSQDALGVVITDTRAGEHHVRRGSQRSGLAVLARTVCRQQLHDPDRRVGIR